MNLESQVCALEYAKKLKNLGVKQDSFFSWQLSINPGIYKLFPNEPFFPNSNWREDNKKTPPDYGCSAFTVAELGALLPDTTKDEYEVITYFFNDKYNGCHRICYAYDAYEACSPYLEVKGETEANARAKMLIYLLENGLIKND